MTRLIAHRGCAAQFPENTCEAMRRVADHVDAVEFDVRRCASGELVVIHDATVDRVTDRTGRVADLPYAELAACDVLGTGEGVPTLDALLDVVPADVAVNAELKERDVAADLVASLDRRENEVLVSSFLPDALAELRAVDPDVPRAFLFDAGGEPSLDASVESPTGETRESSLDVADDLGCAAVHPSVERCLDGQFVGRAHERGFAVNAWTVETCETARALVDAGVDGLIADRDDLLADRDDLLADRDDLLADRDDPR